MPTQFARYEFLGTELRTRGTYLSDNTSMRRRMLKFDMFFPGCNTRPLTNTDICTCPSIRNVHFELRPDLPFSLIGRERWENMKHHIIRSIHIGGPHASYTDGIPSAYSDLLHYYCKSIPPVPFNGILLQRFQVLLSNGDFQWSGKIPVLGMCISDRLPPNICCLGKDFLQYGILGWNGQISYFYPYASDQQIWACFPDNRFDLPGITPGDLVV